MMESTLLFLGLGLAAATLASILWSIAVPERRIWPPKRYTAFTPVLVWVPTFSLFGILILLGVWGWGDLAVPGWLRFGIGIPLIVIGNIVVPFRGAANRRRERHAEDRWHVSLLTQPSIRGRYCHCRWLDDPYIFTFGAHCRTSSNPCFDSRTLRRGAVAEETVRF